MFYIHFPLVSMCIYNKEAQCVLIYVVIFIYFVILSYIIMYFAESNQNCDV